MSDFSSINQDLIRANAQFQKQYPGESLRRQPIHTIYGGAHLFSSGVAKKFGESALQTLKTYAPDGKKLGEIFGSESTHWPTVYERVVKKLQTLPVEDFRIDFEDGYGNRPDAEEDGHAVSVAKEVAKGFAEKTLPPFIGIRIKPFSGPCYQRSQRTLDLFLTTLLSETKGKLPEGFLVTLPKITIPEQARALAQILTAIEKKTGLANGTLKYEFMVETTQAIIGADGRSPLRSFADAGEGRCVAAHFGTYDYTAGCNITATYQAMDHIACDFAKQMMKVTLAGTGLLLSDGATNVMPVGPHKGELTEAQRRENEAVVHRAWRLSFGHIRHSLSDGFYQGWDLHPAQLPVRYAAVYSFFMEGLAATTDRLRGFIQKAAQATLLGDVFDDAATGQGLLNFFLRGLSCGALTEAEAHASGLTVDELKTRSFLAILEMRKRS